MMQESSTSKLHNIKPYIEDQKAFTTVAGYIKSNRVGYILDIQEMPNNPHAEMQRLAVEICLEKYHHGRDSKENYNTNYKQGKLMNFLKN